MTKSKIPKEKELRIPLKRKITRKSHAVFGERIIDFVKTLPNNIVNRELIRQLVKAGTSVGAN
jgi:hypothetical protein